MNASTAFTGQGGRLPLDLLPLGAIPTEITPLGPRDEGYDLGQPLAQSRRPPAWSGMVEVAPGPGEEAAPPAETLDQAALDLAAPLPQSHARPRRPLSRFIQEEDPPNFYISLSDLMCLLLVCFVLIFSLSDPAALPARGELQRDQAPPVGVYRAAMPRASLDFLPSLEPLPASTTLGLVAVASAGQSDPGLGGQSAPPAEPGPRRGLVFDRALLTLVSASDELPAQAQPQDEPRLSELLNQVKDQTKGLEVERGPDRLVLRLPESITFDLAKAEIKPAMGANLAKLADMLARRADMAVIVTGHTDDLPISTPQYASNWELSAARAAAVARALLAKGLDKSRVTIRGLADQHPRLPNLDEYARQQNRRVEIELRPLG